MYGTISKLKENPTFYINEINILQKGVQILVGYFEGYKSVDFNDILLIISFSAYELSSVLSSVFL